MLYFQWIAVQTRITVDMLSNCIYFSRKLGPACEPFVIIDDKKVSVYVALLSAPN